MEPQQTPPPSPWPSLPLLPSATASISTSTSSGGAARSRGTSRHAAAGGTFHDCSAATAEDGPAGGARGAPGEPGGGAVNGGVRGAPNGGGATATDVERAQPHGAHPRFLQHPAGHDQINVQKEVVQRIRKRNRAYEQRVLYMRSIHHDPVFIPGLSDRVFVDKQWYSITQRGRKYTQKIMILTVVAQPRFYSYGNCSFDGKIGCFPFVKYEVAKRSNVKWPAGRMVMKPIDPVKEEIFRDYMIEKVLPAIRGKWPTEDANKPIIIQQDNDEPHLAPNNPLFCEAAKEDGFNITLIHQPENSPNFSALDLGLFTSAAQSIQYKTTEKLVTAIHHAFEGYSVLEAKGIFLALHGCKEVIRNCVSL